MIDGKFLIEKLILYAKTHLCLDELDVIYTRNTLLHEFGFNSPLDTNSFDFDANNLQVPDSLIEEIIEFAIQNGLANNENEGELFASYVFGILTPKPSTVNSNFMTIKENFGSQKACDYLNELCVKNYFIKKSAVDKNVSWVADKLRVPLQISIGATNENCNIKQIDNAYPTCPLCIENEGHYGNETQYSCSNSRAVSINLGEEEWGLKYCPYPNFNEHFVAFNKNHTPMKVTGETVNKLFDFIENFPSYFIGSNASLPIVSGSILNHEHYEGGKQTMPLSNCKVLKSYKSKDYQDVAVDLLDFYNSAIRISGFNRNSVELLATEIIEKWSNYCDETVGIIASTNEEMHNSVTLVARFLADNRYCVELILRNNRTSEEYPNGIFNLRKEHQNVKSDNVGLIESMGLFVLPDAFKVQFKDIANILCHNVEYDKDALNNKKDQLYIHRKMIETLIKKHPNVKDFKKAISIIHEYVNKTCVSISESTAVFKRDNLGTVAFNKFLGFCNLK